VQCSSHSQVRSFGFLAGSRVKFHHLGSGITVYVLQAGPQGMSASLSIDSGTATTATLGAPPSPQYYIPQVVLFNVQNIASGTHTAVMTVLDWNGGFSGMMLDYFDINQAEVAGPITSSSLSPTTQSPYSTPPPVLTETIVYVTSVFSVLPSSTGSSSPTSKT
jgi:hypothetical protein